MKVKKNDKVAVIAGKDKDKEGKITRVLRDENKVVVENVNVVTKHFKKTRERAGERVKLEAPIDASNVQIICPSCKKRSRVKMEVSKSGKKIRSCKKCDASMEQPFVKS